MRKSHLEFTIVNQFETRTVTSPISTLTSREQLSLVRSQINALLAISPRSNEEKARLKDLKETEANLEKEVDLQLRERELELRTPTSAAGSGIYSDNLSSFQSNGRVFNS